MKIYFETCFKNFLCFVTFECFGECDQYKKTPSSPFCILKVFFCERDPRTEAWERCRMGTYLVWSRKWVWMLEPNFQLARWSKFHHNSNLKSLHNHIPSKFSFFKWKIPSPDTLSLTRRNNWGLRRTPTSSPSRIFKILVPVLRLLVAIPHVCAPGTKVMVHDSWRKLGRPG